MNFYVEYYCSPNKYRQQEIDSTLKHNISLGFLDNIYIFTSKEYYENLCSLIDNNNNINIVITNQERQTFQDVFNFANSVCDSSTINITANNDIVFTDSFNKLYLADTDFYAISRFESVHNKCPFRYQECDSQDTWIWKGFNKITDAHFHFGVLGCDNAVAFLARKHYNISNPAFTYRTIHNHQSNFRLDSGKESLRLQLPYHKVKAIHAKTKKTTI